MAGVPAQLHLQSSDSHFAWTRAESSVMSIEEAIPNMNLAKFSSISSVIRLLGSISGPVVGCGVCVALWFVRRDTCAIRDDCSTFRKEFKKISRTLGNMANTLGMLTESAIRLTQMAKNNYNHTYLESCCLNTLSDVAKHCCRFAKVETIVDGRYVEVEVQETEATVRDLAELMLGRVHARMLPFLQELSEAQGNGPDTAFVVDGRIALDVRSRLEQCGKLLGKEKVVPLLDKAVKSLSMYFSLLEQSNEAADNFLIDGGSKKDGLGLMIYLSGISQKLFQSQVEMDCRGRILQDDSSGKRVITVECAEIKVSADSRHTASAQLNLQLLLIHSALVLLNPEAEFKLVGRMFFGKKSSKKSGRKTLLRNDPPARIFIPEDGILSSKSFSRAELGLDDDSFSGPNAPLEVEYSEPCSS